MSLDRTVEVLRVNPIFAKLDPKRLRVVAMMGETLSYPPNERLFEKGDDGDAAFIVTEGFAQVLVPVPGGEKPVARLGQGEIFGEMAVLTDQPRSTAIAADGPLEVLRIEKSALLGLLREFPDIALETIRIMARRLETTTADYARAQVAREG